MENLLNLLYFPIVKLGPKKSKKRSKIQKILKNCLKTFLQKTPQSRETPHSAPRAETSLQTIFDFFKKNVVRKNNKKTSFLRLHVSYLPMAKKNKN